MHFYIENYKHKKEEKKQLIIKSEGKREKYLMSTNLIGNSTNIINLKIMQKMYTKYV